MDIAIALLPSLLFGSTSLLLMALGGDSRQQSMGQLLGGFVVSVVTLPFFGFLPSWQDNLVAVIAGALLASGLVLQVRTFHTVGVARTMPISTGGQIFMVSLVGVLLLGEWRGPGALPVGLAGLSVIIAGVAATCWTERSATKTVQWRGSIWMLVGGILTLSFYVLILRIFDVDPVASLFPLSLGFLTVGFVLTSPRFSPHLGPVDTRWSRITARQMLSGIVWGSGTVIMQYSAANVGVATGFTLSQLGVALSTLGAVAILGEKRTSREWWMMTFGIALLIGGTVLVGYAKSLDA